MCRRCARCLAAAVAGDNLHRETIVGVQIAQNQRAPCQVGPARRITFKYLPGRIFPGKVERVLQAVSAGQTQVSGQAVRP